MLSLLSNESTKVQLSFDLRWSIVQLTTIVSPHFRSEAEAVKEETHSLNPLSVPLYRFFERIVVLWLRRVKHLLVFSLNFGWHESKQACEKQVCLEEALIRIKEQLHDQEEYVMQTAYVSQPIEYAVGLSSRCFNYVGRYENSFCKVVKTQRFVTQILSPAIFSWFLTTNANEIFLFLLTVLKPVSLILNRVSVDLNFWPLCMGLPDVKSLLKNFRLFDYSLFPKFLQVKTFRII